MAKVYTGRDGVLRLDDKDLAKVVNFQLSANLETLETTTLSEHLRSYEPGVVGYSGSATLLYYKEDNNTFNTTGLLSSLYKADKKGVKSKDTVELTLRWKDGLDSNDIKLNAYITSATIGAATGEIVRAEIAFQATGKLLKVTIS